MLARLFVLTNRFSIFIRTTLYLAYSANSVETISAAVWSDITLSYFSISLSKEMTPLGFAYASGSFLLVI